MPSPINVSPRGLRQTAQRAQVHLDVVAAVCHDDHAADNTSAVDVPATRALAAWGLPVDVRGRDHIEVMLTFTKVAGQTSLTVAIQSSVDDSRDNATWFDRHTTHEVMHGDLSAIPTTPGDPTLDVSGFADGVHRIVFEVRTLLNFMRFKPYGGGTLAASRCKIEAVRVMEAS